jgi:hypothetical protein
MSIIGELMYGLWNMNGSEDEADICVRYGTISTILA